MLHTYCEFRLFYHRTLIVVCNMTLTYLLLKPDEQYLHPPAEINTPILKDSFKTRYPFRMYDLAKCITINVRNDYTCKYRCRCFVYCI